MRHLLLASSAALALTVIGCGPPVMNTPVAEIPNLTTLEAVMDNQATVADPQFKKIGETSYQDADYAAFAAAAERLQATGQKTKDFSQGAEFDAFADQLAAKAKALGEAASAKDAAAASQALEGIKATCKACHSQFR